MSKGKGVDFPQCNQKIKVVMDLQAVTTNRLRGINFSGH